LTLVAGEAAIRDNAYYMDNCKKIIEAREFTTRALRELGFYVLDSKANFVFAKHESVSGEELYIKLKENGILVRHFSAEKIKEFNRITIGTLDEMKTFINKVQLILEEKL
jgi:histidinol-phosphate aminotransferase